MFSNQRRASGLFGLVGVAVLGAAWLGLAGLMWTSYAEGAGGRAADGCELVCKTGLLVKARS